MDIKPIVVGIYLGKKDADLKRWFKNIRKSDLEQSFYIRQAIIAHINGDDITLGSVCPLDDAETIRTSYTVSPDDVNIMKLVNSLNDLGVKVSSYIKRAIRDYIDLVGSVEEEFIPGYFQVHSTGDDAPAIAVESHTAIRVENIEEDLVVEDEDVEEEPKKRRNPLIDDYV